MFSIFMSDDTYLSTQDLIDMLDLMEMLCDVDILHSNNLNETVEKTKEKTKRGGRLSTILSSANG